MRVGKLCPAQGMMTICSAVPVSLFGDQYIHSMSDK